jgi:ribosomal protein L7/L12
MPDTKGPRRRGWRLDSLWRTADPAVDRKVGDALVTLLDPDGQAEVGALLARGEKMAAVRRVRQLTGVRLLDATRLVGSLQP